MPEQSGGQTSYEELVDEVHGALLAAVDRIRPTLDRLYAADAVDRLRPALDRLCAGEDGGPSPAGRMLEGLLTRHPELAVLVADLLSGLVDVLARGEGEQSPPPRPQPPAEPAPRRAVRIPVKRAG